MKITVSQLPKDDIEHEKKLNDLQKEEDKHTEELKLMLEKQKELHRKKLEQERIEMLRLKQGITDDEVILSDSKPVVEKPKGFKALENFWYHNSLYVIIITVFLVIGGFLLHNLMTTVKPDLNILVLPDSGISQRFDKITACAEQYADDINSDGNVKINMIHIPLESFGTNPSADTAYQTKFTAELLSGKTMLIISNEACDELLMPQGILLDLRTIYPDNENITQYGLKLEGEKVKEAFGWDNMPEGIYIGIRDPKKIPSVSAEKAKKQFEQSIKVIDGLVKQLG